MEHGLFAIELRDWWQDSSGITSEQYNISRVLVRDTGDLRIVNIFDGVGTTDVSIALSRSQPVHTIGCSPSMSNLHSLPNESRG